MHVLQISLRRFRAFEDFSWCPTAGINCIVGAGDAGKTTILDAVARATSAAPAAPASEHDYFRRRTERGFEIELVIGGLTDELKSAVRPPALWGWRGPNQHLEDAPVSGTEPVLRVVARGTPDLETEHRLISPDGDELNFSVEKRRALGLCRVGEARGSTREFRMARGSLLERTLGRDDVRGAAAQAVRHASRALELPVDVAARLAHLGDVFRDEGVATDEATLEVLSPPGQSLLGLLGLALGESGEAVPLASAGQGTQRLASFVLARELTTAPSLLVMDEVESGLEPYRRRVLISQLRGLLLNGGQAFLTTHSPTVVQEMETAELKRLVRSAGPDGAPRVLDVGPALKKAKQADPEALLCRLPVVCEGATEERLLRTLLDSHSVGPTLAALGIHFVDGEGQPQAFGLVDAYIEAGFPVGMFLDNETEHRGRREDRTQRPAVVAGSWSGHECTEKALAAELPLEGLAQLLEVGDPARKSRLAESRARQLAELLGAPGLRTLGELVAEFDSDAVRAAWGESAHRFGWFKASSDVDALTHWLSEPGRLPETMAGDLRAFAAALVGQLDQF